MRPTRPPLDHADHHDEGTRSTSRPRPTPLPPPSPRFPFLSSFYRRKKKKRNASQTIPGTLHTLSQGPRFHVSPHLLAASPVSPSSPLPFELGGAKLTPLYFQVLYDVFPK